MRPGLRLAPLFVLLAASVVLATPASAAGTITVSQTDGLTELQTVTVGGTGFDPAEQIYVCQGGAPLGIGATFCGNTILSLVPVSSTGEFSTPYTVRRFIYAGGLGRTVDCADPAEDCNMFVQAFSPSGVILQVPISFADSPPPPATKGSITVSPDHDLQGQDVVTVSGTGFRPNAPVEVLQCGPAPEDPTDCNFFGFTTATTGASGAFVSQHTVTATMSPPSGVGIDCRSGPGACVLAAAETVDLRGTIVTAPVSFAAHASTAVVVSPSTDLVARQVVAVSGSGFTPGAQVAWCQGVRSSSPSQNDCGTSFQFAIADAQGHFSGSQQVQRTMFVSSLGLTIDCATTPDTCIVGAAEVSAIATTVAYAPLQFAPAVLPGVGTVVEGNTGTRTLSIPVKLSAPSPSVISVDWRTAHVGGASGSQADPADDYAPASGTVTFPAGETNQVVTVSVNGDTDFEANEYFVVAFTNPTHAVIGGFWGLGFGIIANDDVIPTVLPGGSTALESNSGSHVQLIPVTLTAPSTEPVTVEWTTLFVSGGTFPQADPSLDYTPAAGTVTFAPGETSQSVAVTVNGDTSVEPDEIFVVSFRNPTNAVMGGFWGLGFGVITNDD